MIKSWVFDAVDYPSDEADPSAYDPQIAAAALDRHFETWAGAEGLGFEGVFLSEHHFGPANLGSSPNLLLAGLAARTRRLRIGVLAQVAPLYSATRLVEECGLLDLLSHGRLEIGVARGLGFIDTDRLGISREEVRERFEETLDILELGLTQGPISYQGKYNNFSGITLSPRPLQQPRPPIWQSVRTPQSAAAASRRGFKVCGAYEPAEEIAAVFDAYREAADRLGRPAGPGDLGLRRHVFVAETEQAAKDFCGKSLHAESFKYGGPDSPLGRSLLTGVDAIAGTPAQVADEIQRQLGLIGGGHLLMMMVPGHSQEGMERSMRLYGEAVIPLLSQADNPAVARQPPSLQVDIST